MKSMRVILGTMTFGKQVDEKTADLKVISIDHLKANLQTCEAAELPQAIVDAYDKAWEITKIGCPQYFR